MNIIFPNYHAYNGILSGHCNLISDGSYSSVSGGMCNTTSGYYSAILGGSGNNDNGLNYVGIFGQNINNPANMAPNTFHVNCLNAINTPMWNLAAFPSGTIYYFDPVLSPPLPPGACPLYIF